MHDIGKYSNEFQLRLEGSPEKVDHSTAGAHVALSLYGELFGKMLAYPIVGHHGGMPDWEDASPSSLKARLAKKDLKGFSKWEDEISDLVQSNKPQIKLKGDTTTQGFHLTNYIRMIYSCLVDADFLDTEKAFGSINSEYRGNKIDLSVLHTLLESKLALLANDVNSGSINLYRSQILSQCIKASDLDRGLFTLTVPTGGGKTLSSMAFALKHAIRNGMKRIIYVIPYTSIIEQNARIFKSIFGEDNVLEHHSNYSFDDLLDAEDGSDDSRFGLRLASQNWDAPIIVTTNVQFFESFFSNRPSKCRKLHNVANSVVILDEAQMLPTELLKPSVALLGDLVLNYKSSIVLCTATQPTLNSFLPKQMNIHEIMDSPRELYEVFRRVQITSLGQEEILDEDLALLLNEHHQVLCIVNTRNHAYKLYEMLNKTDGVFHLSARMCPEHRRAVLGQIRQRLATNQTCKVISTQLIEAGVDVDFPVVYRSVAGIDSIAQSAGRCNREGRLSSGIVYVFEPEKHGRPDGYMSLTASKARATFRNFEDPLSLEAVSSYFDDLYHTQDEQLDKNSIMGLHKNDTGKMMIPFNEIAQSYKIISNGMKSIIVPYGEDGHESEKIIKNMTYSRYPGAYARKLQKYTVQIYPYELKALEDEGAIVLIQEAYHVLTNSDLYSDEFGLKIPIKNQGLKDTLIF
jgi:CRISPR-associated endonuclease/helicase Cas3